MSKKKNKFKNQPKYRSLKENAPLGSDTKIEGRETLPVTEVKETASKSLIPPALILAAFFFYDEIILKKDIGAARWWPSLLIILFFSLSFGFIVWLITALFKKESVSRGLRIFTVTAAAVLFLVNYFIFHEFKIFYDINTAAAGASDALGQFGDLIKELILNPNGIRHILLYLLPCLLYFVFRKKIDHGHTLENYGILKSIGAAALSFALALGTIAGDSALKTAYFDQYNFQNSISSFGLLTALRQDLNKTLFGRSNEFRIVEEEETAVNEDTEGNRYNIHTPNQMLIDFDALAADGSDLEARLDNYVKNQKPSMTNDYTGLFEGKNLIMITAEAFSGKIIDKDLTPTLYRLANNGFRFTDFYQPASAGTTGGEYEVLFGMLPSNGGSSMKLTSDYHNVMTLASQLDRLGYEGWAFHNNDYTFYDRNETHNNLGYSHGFMGYGSGMEDYVEDVWPQSDLEMFEGTAPMYLDQDKPFNVYYMTVSGHNGYDHEANAMSNKNWDRVQDLPYSDYVKGYIAANLELEDALTYLVGQLEEKGIADDTVIVLCPDHFPYGLDYEADLGEMVYLSELYGHDVNDFLDRDQNTLIIWSGSLEKEEPVTVDTPVSSLDILPTLCNLFGTEFDSRLFPGRDVFSSKDPLVFDIYYDWKTEKGTYNALTDTFTPSGEAVDDAYISRIKDIVANKITYCEGVNDTDYFYHVFPDLAQ